MDAKLAPTSLLRRSIPLYIVLPALVVTCLCGFIAGAMPSATSKTPTPEPVAASLLSPTARPSPTSSSTPPTPTGTPTQTPSPPPTATRTPTPAPLTQTALVHAESQTAQAAARTATRQALNATQTSQSQASTSTREALNAQRTAAARATAAQATLIAQYASIDFRELVNYADAHIGEKVRVRGRVFNINSNTELQMYFAGTYDAVYIVMAEPLSGIYENDVITVYGTVLGENCGTNAFGAEICQPLLFDAFYTR